MLTIMLLSITINETKKYFSALYCHNRSHFTSANFTASNAYRLVAYLRLYIVHLISNFYLFVNLWITTHHKGEFRRGFFCLS